MRQPLNAITSRDTYTAGLPGSTRDHRLCGANLAGTPTKRLAAAEGIADDEGRGLDLPTWKPFRSKPGSGGRELPGTDAWWRVAG